MTYTVGDVFLGCPGSASGRPYTEPTVLHYATDGVTLLETLTVPAGAPTTQTYRWQGIAVGADGRLYVLWSSDAGYTRLSAFSAAGAWVGDLATVSATDWGGAALLAHPGGDLLVPAVFDSPDTNSKRYDASGTLLTSWPSPFGIGNGPDAACSKPGNPDVLLLGQNDQLYELHTVTGVQTGPVTLPVVDINHYLRGLYANDSAAWILTEDGSGGWGVWSLQQLDATFTGTVGAPAEIGSADFSVGGIDRYGIFNPPFAVAVNRAGTVGWGVTYTVDASHAGTAVDSFLRTDLRSTALPGGTSVTMQSDVNGDTDLVYVAHLAGVAAARRRSRVGLLR